MKKNKMLSNKNLVFLIVSVCGIAALFFLSYQSSQQTALSYTLPDGTSSSEPFALCDISDFGTIPDDLGAAKDNREKIQHAIDTCVTSNSALYIPKGLWYTGGLYFHEHGWLKVDPDATLSFIYDPELYTPLRPSRFEGYDLINFSAPIYFDTVKNGGINGGGMITIAQPKQWHAWDKRETPAKKRLHKFGQDGVPLEDRIFGRAADGLRPPFVQLYNVENFVIDDVTIEDSTMWTLHILYSNNVLAQNLSITTRGPNVDGIVIDSSTNVTVQHSTLHTGDDALVLKSGADKDGQRINKPTKNIIIRDVIINEAHGAIVIGSEMSGGIEDVDVFHITINEADIGLRIKTRPGRGGYVRNITFSDVNATTLRDELVRINAHYREAVGDTGDTSENLKHPILESIDIRDVHAQKTKRALRIDGLLQLPLRDLSINNLSATQEKRSSILNTEAPELTDVIINFLYEHYTGDRSSPIIFE